MKISTILDYIDSGFIALPTFQRGYVWNRDQVRALMDSLYRKHPVGSLLVWVTGGGSGVRSCVLTSSEKCMVRYSSSPSA